MPESGIVQELGVKVGDLFVESWGYDQTNINFYKVVGVTKASVKIVEVAKRTVSSNGPSDKVVPVPEVELDRGRLSGYGQRSVVALKRVQRGYQGRPSLNVSSYSSAELWDGEPEYETASGWGH